MRSTSQLFIFLLILLSLQISGCQKEPLLDQQSEVGEAVLRDGTAVGSGQPVTIEEAAAWFDNMADPTDFTVENFKLLSLDPAWLQSYSTNVGEVEGLLVPVLNDLDSIFPNSFYNLFFFRDSSAIICRMIVFKSYNDISNAVNIDMSTFKGMVFQISPDNHVAGFGLISAGKFIPLIIQDSIVSSVYVSATYRDCPVCDWFVDLFNNCFDFNAFNWHGFWADVDKWFLTTDFFEWADGSGNNGWGSGGFSGWNFMSSGYWNTSGSNWFGLIGRSEVLEGFQVDQGLLQTLTLFLMFLHFSVIKF